MDKYIVYYNYKNLSLIDSSISLLKLLDIDFIFDDIFESYGNYFSYIVNEKKFILTQAYNLALAASKERNLLILEEDAYRNLMFAKNLIDNNSNLLKMVNIDLEKLNMKYIKDANIKYILHLLMENENINKIKTLKKVGFYDFEASLFCDYNLEKHLFALFEILNLKISFKDNKSYYQHEIFNENLSYKYSALGFESALDSGCDFIVANSMGMFNMFDNKRSKMEKSINRNLGKMPILFLPQLILLSFGIKNDISLAFRYHKFNPDFI